MTSQRGADILNVVGRLKPGVSQDRARAELDVIARQIAAQYPDTNKPYTSAIVKPMLEHLVGDVHQPLHATSRFSVDLPMGDRGGNSVALCASPCKDELHAFWDEVLGTRKLPATAITAADKLPAAPAADAAVADEQTWITESFEAAKQFVYAAPVGPGAGPYTLDATYKLHAKTEAKARIELAGIRLANLINAKLK